MISHTDNIYVIGAGGHAKVVLATLHAMAQKVKCILDDDKTIWGKSILGIEVKGSVSSLQNSDRPTKAIIAIGDSKTRKMIADSLPNVEWVNAIHPSALIHSSVKIGNGTVIFAGTVIQPDTIIGNHCIVNTSASIDHDCSVKDYVHIAPGCHLAGGVTLSEGAFLGIGSSVIPGVAIGHWSVCGAGSVIVRDIPDNAKAFGVPAKMHDLN